MTVVIYGAQTRMCEKIGTERLRGFPSRKPGDSIRNGKAETETVERKKEK